MGAIEASDRTSGLTPFQLNVVIICRADFGQPGLRGHQDPWNRFERREKMPSIPIKQVLLYVHAET